MKLKDILTYKPSDLFTSVWIFKAAGLNSSQYVQLAETGVPFFTEAGERTMIAKLLENRDAGFTLVYQDEEIIIYEI